MNAERKRQKRRAYLKRRAERRRLAQEKASINGELDTMQKLSEYHYRFNHAGMRVDYWPSTQKFRIGEETFQGNAADARAKIEGMK